MAILLSLCVPIHTYARMLSLDQHHTKTFQNEPELVPSFPPENAKWSKPEESFLISISFF